MTGETGPVASTGTALLMRRAGFGAGTQEPTGAYEQVVAALVAPTGEDPGRAATPPPDLGPQPQDPGRKAPKDAQQAYTAQRRQQGATLTGWWLDRMVAARDPFPEKLTFFWHGHFATSIQKVHSARLMQMQNTTLRDLGRGSFLALAKAMVRDPAMLVWLDGRRNRAGTPNENFGRELLELFCLGHGHYTDADVKEAARALTGWTVDKQTGAAQRVETRYDSGPKTVLGTRRAFDDQTLVDLLVARPESARHLVGRMWARFASGAAPSPETLDALVSAYGAGRDVSAAMTALFLSAQFRASAGTLAKQPVELTVGALRAFDLRPSRLPVKDQQRLVRLLEGMGQVPFRPPSVGGWPAGRAWLGTSATASRIALGGLLAAHADLTQLTATRPADRPDLLGRVLSVDDWTPRTRAVLADAAADVQRLVKIAVAAPEYAVT